VVKYEVCLWSSRTDFIAILIPVCLQLAERIPWAAMHLAQKMLPFLELLLQKSFQCHHHFWMSSISWNLRPFKIDFISGNSQKSFRANQGKGHVFYFSNWFLGQKLVESALWTGAMSWWRKHSLGKSSGLLLCTASCSHFNISST